MTKKTNNETLTPEAGIKSGLAAFMSTMSKAALPDALVNAAAKWAAGAEPVFYRSSGEETHRYAANAQAERFALLLASFTFPDCSPCPLSPDGLPALGEFVQNSERHARQLAEAGKLKVSRRAHSGELPPALTEKGGVKAFLAHLADIEPLDSKPAILPSSPKPGSGKAGPSIEEILGDLF